MDSPFETPFTVLEDEPEGRHTRVLRPYLAKLQRLDRERPVHANTNNTFDTLRHRINEEMLEYWVSDSDEADENSDIDAADDDGDGESAQKKKRRRLMKKKKKKTTKRGKEVDLKDTKLTHETQVVENVELAAEYEFNSKEVVHLRQQMYLSLQARTKSKDRRKLPSEMTAKDLKNASITLSGMEPRLKPVYFNKSIDSNRVSFIRYQSRIIDTLFYICLFQQKWKLCFKLFKIIITTFGSDIFQMWTLGVHLLTQLNMVEFESNFKNEWERVSNDEPPKLSVPTLKNLSFLQNPHLVSMLMTEKVDDLTMTVLKRTVTEKRQMQSHILKFIKLLMRTSRNQQPLSGGFPEQTYVPHGVLGDDENGEQNEQNADEEKKDANESDDDKTSDVEVPPVSNTRHLGPQINIISRRKPENNTETDQYTETGSSDEEIAETNESDDNNDPNSNKTIIIRNAEFNPHAETHLPHQQTYLRSLRRHSTPLHRLGTRTRTPTYTLTLLWMLVRTGRIDGLQRILEPLLLIVPTSTDARVALSDIMAKIMDVCANIQILDRKEQGDWESCASLDKKMIDLSDSWVRWKDQFTSKRKRLRGARQYVDYQGVDDCLLELTEMVSKAIAINKQDFKKNDTDDSSSSDSEDEDESSNADDITGNATAYVTAINDDTRDDTMINVNDDYLKDEVLEEEEFVDFEDDEETQAEMERLMGYAEMVTNDASSDNESDHEVKIVKKEKKEEEKEDDLVEWEEEEEDIDDEETQRELDRLMGYAERAGDSGSEHEELDDERFSDNEKLDIETTQFDEFQDAVEFQDSDSE